MSSILPEELILEILSRIPIKDVCTCKCVCKSWLNLLKTPEFISSHLSKSVPRLLVNHYTRGRITVFQFLFDVEQCSRRRQKSYNNPRARMECSINGLILFQKFRSDPEEYYICNPITRECVRLPELPQTTTFSSTYYGFGISRSGRKYKVVRMLKECLCQVYTLGGRTWRSIAGNDDDERLSVYSKGTFLNGNLHWLVEDSERAWWVSCFDLETEALTKFRAPTESLVRDIGVCLCDIPGSLSDEFVIYTMSCYEKKFWVRECVIRKSSDLVGVYIYPIKFFGDSNGGVLMAFHDQYSNLFFYSNKRTDLIGEPDFICGDDRGEFFFEAVLYTPSFVSPRAGPGQQGF